MDARLSNRGAFWAADDVVAVFLVSDRAGQAYQALVPEMPLSEMP